MLSKVEQNLFAETIATQNWDLFTEQYFSLPKSGTWYTPEDRPHQYAALHKLWESQNKPPRLLSAQIEGVATEVDISWDRAYYGDMPLFLIRHGYRMLPWAKTFFDVSKPLGIAITGVATGKTSAAAMFAMMLCALHPGFDFLNVAPSRVQANLMLKEVRKWCTGSPFEKFIKVGRNNKFWTLKDGHPQITIEVYEGYPSTFTCQTVGNDATAILGGEYDFINFDESQLLQNIQGVIPILASRFRGTRNTGELRWSLLRWITNPGFNPELEELLDQYSKLEKIGKAVVLTDVPSEVNIYITRRQMEQQRLSIVNDMDRERWHGGSMAAINLDGELPPKLWDNCKNDALTKVAEKVGKIDSSLGLTGYQIPWDITKDPDKTFIVVGDVGKSSRVKLSSHNVPCVAVFEIPENFMEAPCRLQAFHWFDGEGTYSTFIGYMRSMMYKYRARGYYDATNVQTALEDLGGSGAFANLPTTPIYFSGPMHKKWSVAVLALMLQHQLLEIPYIKALWYQAKIFDSSKKHLVDDIIATFLVLMLAFRIESTLYDKLATKFQWDIPADTALEDLLYDITDPHAGKNYPELGRYDRI